MNGTIKILATHLDRLAIVYLRQSSPKQVLQNRESAVNQRAIKERLLKLGWDKQKVTLIDEDQGISAKHAAGREGFKKLAAEVGLGKVGLIAGYEVSRLSRNCADWHQLLDLCALFGTLIADMDGIYDPRDYNDRLLLGLKGTMSAAELHSLRLRLDAGRLSKAKRGELVHHLPTGLVRTDAGPVILDPDSGVRERIRLVFDKFLELGTGQKVLSCLVRHGLKLPRRQTSGLYARQVLWKEPTLSALYVILKNPAYAGAFAYGRRTADPTRQVPGRPATGRRRRPREEWIALVKDVYPHYITWSQFETIQQTIEENRQRMENRFARKRGIRRGAALISGLIRCGRCGHCMRVAYKGNRFQYVCSGARNKYAKPSCQFLSGHRIDAAVLEEFFQVLQPAQIDALERVSAKQAAHHRQLIEHLKKEVQRLDYEAQRAERQYDLVDPENRLITATLEQKWEYALGEREQAKGRLADASQQTPTTVVIPDELRDAFADVGKRLPELWAHLSVEAKKSLMRTLVSGVNLLRGQDGTVQIRIVWRGGSVTETSARLPVHSLRYTQTEQQVAERIRQLAAGGRDNEQIVQQLNDEGFVPCRGGRFTPQIVNKIKARYEIVSNIEHVRRGGLPFADTLREVAQKVDVDPSWIYRRISNQTIHIEKDPQYHCYLFPRDRHVIQQLKQLKAGSLQRVSIPKVHHNG